MKQNVSFRSYEPAGSFLQTNACGRATFPSYTLFHPHLLILKNKRKSSVTHYRNKLETETHPTMRSLHPIKNNEIMADVPFKF